MKRLKRMFYTLMCLCLLLLTSMPVSAKEEEYTYTVRFFAGKQGTFQNGDIVVVEKELHYGDRINFYYNAIKLNDNSKYYIRGIRESGKDNSDSFQTSSFLVTGDMDYVIAYGILGDATSYTIHYVDEAGNELAPSETYYGNVGDRPVVAYIYIEGWMPQAYNMTQTLKKDPAENEFSFVYTRIPEPVAPQPPAPGPAPQPQPPVQPPVEEPAAPGPVTPEVPGIVVIPVDPTPLGPGPGGEDIGGGDEENPGGEDEENTGLTEVDLTEDPTPLGNADELQDLDEQETPLSGFLSFDSDARLLGIPIPVVIIIAMGAIGVIGIAWYFLFARRRKKAEEDEEEQA